MTPIQQHAPADARRAWVLLALFVGAYCINVFVPRDLWVQDEARYGEVVREMRLSHQWLVPTLNGEPYPDKPPLYFWAVAALSSATGPGELAFRLVTLLSTLAAVAGVYLLGRELLGAAVGFWSAAIFSTTFLTLVVGQIVRMDMLLTAAATFAWLGLTRLAARSTAAPLLAFWSCSALAVAVKGPIALLFTVAPAVVWMFLQGGWSGLRALRPLAGLGALAALVAVWAALVLRQGHAAYLQTIWQQQILGRAVNAWSHPEPFYFYVLLAPLLLMPWTAVMVRGTRALVHRREPVWRALAAFALIPLAGISLISGKLFIYMEPLVPALALAAGSAAPTLAARRRIPRWIGWPPIVFLLLLATAIVWFAAEQLQERAWQGYLVAGALATLAGAGAALQAGDGRRWLRGWLVLSVLLSWLLFGATAYLVNPLYSGRSLGHFVAATAAPGAPVGTAGVTPGIFNYYAGRRYLQLDPAEAASWLRRHPRGLLILNERDAAGLLRDGQLSCDVSRSFRVALKNYRVLGRCGGPPPASSQ